jgi:hypothetical protein
MPRDSSAFVRVFAGISLACLSAAAYALGGDKSENFNGVPNATPAPGWAAFNGTWGAQDGEYRNNDTGPNPTIAWFNDNTWRNNFTLDVSILAEWPSTGNLVGAVFGYTDSSNYFQIMTSMSGDGTFQNMTLKKFVGGQVTNSLAVNTASKGATLTQDTPFALKLFVNANKITVKVNGKIVFNQVDFGTLPEGKLGLTSRANKGHFDNFVVTDNRATQLFSASFTGAVIGTRNPDTGQDPHCNNEPNGNLNCYLYVSGQDASGYTWPIRIWGANGRFQQITKRADATPATSRQFVDAQIVTLSPSESRTGNSTHALHQILRTPGSGGDFPQIPYMFQPPTGVTQGDLYAKFWMKIRGATSTDNTVTSRWRIPFQFKTSSDYRTSLSINTWNYSSTYYPSCDSPRVTDNHVHWLLQGESWAAVSDPEHPHIWQRCVTDQATTPAHRVPINEWFKLEFFFRRSKTGPGHIWVDVNGNNIFNYRADDGLYGADPAKQAIDRLMLPQLYLGDGAALSYPQEQWIDDLEIWDGVPAGVPPHPLPTL